MHVKPCVNPSQRQAICKSGRGYDEPFKQGVSGGCRPAAQRVAAVHAGASVVAARRFPLAVTMVQVHSHDPYAVGRTQELKGKPNSAQASPPATALPPEAEQRGQSRAPPPGGPAATGAHPPPHPPASLVCRRPASCWRRWPSRCSPSCGAASWRCPSSASSSEEALAWPLGAGGGERL